MSPAPVLLFGACDRHNLGDLLLAHCAQADLEGRPALHVGLRAVDFRALGGPRVEALQPLLSEWAARYGDDALDIHHIGGETLGTTTWEAALMLQRPATLDALLRRLPQQPHGESWARQLIGSERPLAYLLSRSECPRALRRLEFHAIGGCAFAQLPAEARAYAVQALSGGDRLSVRERVSQAALAEAGITAELSRDPVCGLSRRFATQIRLGGQHSRLQAALRGAGATFCAVQFAAEQGSDACLAQIAAVLNAQGLPVLLFRAGAAPWHDALEPYRRLLPYLRVPNQLFDSLHIWAICALLAASTTVFATSLHVRLLAREFAKPLLALPAGMASAKVRAYEDSWYPQASATPKPA